MDNWMHCEWDDEQILANRTHNARGMDNLYFINLTNVVNYPFSTPVSAHNAISSKHCHNLNQRRSQQIFVLTDYKMEK